MITEIQTDANAPWKKRFLASSIHYSKVAAAPSGGDALHLQRLLGHSTWK